MSEAEEDPKDQVAFFLRAIGTAGYDHAIIQCTRCVSASKEEVVFEVTVTSDICNSLGSMHGGALATAIDLLTSAAITPHSREGFWELAGVSRQLNVTYLRPAKIDTKVLFRCKVISLGKRTAALGCEVMDAVSKKLIAVGFHDKVNIDGPRM